MPRTSVQLVKDNMLGMECLTLVITSHGGLGLAVRRQQRKQPGDSRWSNPGLHVTHLGLTSYSCVSVSAGAPVVS